MGIFGLIIILIYNIVLMLLVTLVIASLTLIERKFLSLLQRRVGPNYVGYKGRLQYIADALKLFVKGVLIPYESNRFWFVLIPSIALAICYSFWINSVWGPSLSIFDIEYNTVYASLLSIIFSFCIILTGFFSRNKYAMLASIRTVLLVLNLEIFLGLLILNLVIITESFNFTSFVLFQENMWFIFLYFGLTGVITITFLLETNRAPFDLAEAEGELVGGFHTEYSSLKFALFFLSEYVNIIAVSALATTLFLGGYRALPGLGFTEQWLGGWFTLVWFFVKVLAFFFVFVWLRGTLPRLRYDQFMKFGWKVLIPFSLVWIMIVSTLRVLSQRESSNFLVVAFIFSVALIYIAVTTLIDRAKVKTAIESKITNYSEPDFPVPEIPNSRAEQLNGWWINA